MTKINIITLFPEMFKGPFEESIIKRAQEKGLVEIKIHNLRDWAKDKHKTVDDRPFGGGTGMILMIQPIHDAIESLKSKGTLRQAQGDAEQSRSIKSQKSKIILLSPRGKVFNQKLAKRLSQIDHLILICGHYEGVDERVRKIADEEISIGDYILTGGELPAMVLADTVVRLIPGVLEKSEATKNESFSYCQALKTKDKRQKTNHQLLEHPQYTRPANYKGFKVPKILLSGNHKKIKDWRLKKALELTKKRRPDLLKQFNDSNH